MNEEKGIYKLPDGTLLRFDTYCLKLVGKLLGKSFEETFNSMASITQSIDIVEAFIICGAKSADESVEIDSRKACGYVDQLGGINGNKFIELCLFIVAQYVPEEKKE